MKKVSLIVPVYNSEKYLRKCLDSLVNQTLKDIEIILINDGSKDNTWNLIEEISNKENLFTGISLSRNRGHQNALLAGLMTAKNYADIVISMDADLQDDINAIDEMIEKYNNGAQIVYGVRSSRKKDTAFKRITAEGFYKFMKLMGVEVVFNHADYRLTSKRVLEELENYGEINLFLRGMFPLIGFKTDIVYYERNERFAGSSKYPLKKMLSFAWEGITSFSVKPIKMILNIGIIMFVLSIIMIIYSIVSKCLGNAVDGWTFITCSIWLVSGIQMLSLGIVGEYIGKIYSETKRRPRFIISRNLNEEQKYGKNKKD